ncbi:MAG: cadherin repeat domain-containing protein [Candidatus Thiodiazotropha sp. (ex Codakia orbicularis)]|nr:cadherin repeat domain-containing protein [Candidatus Thiodiazotropha sp. (ex Codakia orbicularis)]
MPDIGNTTEFANYNYLWEGNGNDSLRGIQITMPEDGTAVSISAFITTGANSARTAVFALYDSTGNLLAYSNESAGGHTDEELLTLTLANEVSAGDLDLTNGSSYYLLVAFSGGSAAGGVANDGGTNIGYSGDNSATYPALAATAGTISQSQPDYSVYLTYSTGGAGRSADSLSGAFRRGNTGVTVNCTGLDAAPTTQTVTVTDGTHSDTCTITNWNSGSPIINVDCELPPGSYDIQVTDDTGTVTLQDQTLLIETGYEEIVFSGTTPPVDEESLPRETPVDHPTIPEIVAGDSWGVESQADVTWDTDGQAVIDPAGDHTLNYWFWDDSTGVMYSGETIVIGEIPVLSNPTLTSTGQNTMQGSVDTNVDTGTLYAYWSTSATPPSSTDLKAGTGAAWSGNQAITSTGTKTFNATGLIADTTYYAHFLHDNSGSESDISTSAGVATDAGAADTTPDAITWTDVTGAEPSSSHSDIQQITGVDAGETLNATNCEVSNDNQASWHASVTMVAGQTYARVTNNASASYATAVDLTATVNGVGDVFTITTRAADITPDAFSFTDQTDVALTTVITSNTITVTGVDAGQNVPLTITNGEYSINGGGWASTPTNVQLGDTIQVRHTSSGSYSTDTDTTLDLNGVSDVFTTTTQAAPGNQPPVINDQSFYTVIAPSANLIANGTFDTDLGGWTDAAGHWSNVAGRAHHPLGSDFNNLTQAIALSTDHIYRVTFDYDVITASLKSSWRTAAGTFVSNWLTNLSGTGTHDSNVVIPSNAEMISFGRSSVGVASEFYIDNVSVTPVCPVVIGTVQASDSDEDPLTYSIISGNTGNDLTIDPNTGVLSWANAPDINRTASYDLTVQVDDGTDTASATVTVNVIDVPEGTNAKLSLSLELGVE